MSFSGTFAYWILCVRDAKHETNRKDGYNIFVLLMGKPCVLLCLACIKSISLNIQQNRFFLVLHLCLCSHFFNGGAMYYYIRHFMQMKLMMKLTKKRKGEPGCQGKKKKSFLL